MAKDDSQPDAAARGEALVRKVERVYDGFLKIDKAEISYNKYNGQRTTVTRLSMERGDAAAALLVNLKQRTVRLIEQFRYPTLAKGSGWIMETPAGMIDHNESAEAAAAREIAEETGYSDLKLHHISTFFVSPGGTSERIALFCAFVDDKTADPELSERTKDSDEDIRQVDMDLDAFMKAASNGTLEDAKTLIAGLWLCANKRRLKI